MVNGCEADSPTQRETGINAAVIGRDDRPGHPRARGPPAPTIMRPRQSSGSPLLPPLSSVSPLPPMSPCPPAPSRLRRAHFCTGAPLRFAPLHGFFASLVNVSTCQHVPSRKRVSPCPRAHVSPRGRLRPRAISFPSLAYFLGDGNIPPLGNVTILNSPPDAATHRRYSSCGSLEVEKR